MLHVDTTSDTSNDRDSIVTSATTDHGNKSSASKALSPLYSALTDAVNGRDIRRLQPLDARGGARADVPLPAQIIACSRSGGSLARI